MRELKKKIKLFTIVLVRPLTTPATWSQDELVDTMGHQPFAMCMSSNPSYRDLMCALACTAIYTPCSQWDALNMIKLLHCMKDNK